MRMARILVCCTIVLSLLSLPVLWLLNEFNANYTKAVVLVYLITLPLIFLFYRVAAKKYNSFALPVSFIIFPIILYFIMAGLRPIFDIKSDPEGWEIFVIPVAVFYSLPYAVVTFITSLITERKKKNKRI